MTTERENHRASEEEFTMWSKGKKKVYTKLLTIFSSIGSIVLKLKKGNFVVISSRLTLDRRLLHNRCA